MTIHGWITASNPGSGENWQTLEYLTENDNAALFAVAPAISPAGALSFQPAVNAHGSASISVRARDNGGTANGGVDTSPPQVFTITITPVNQSPIAVDDSIFVHAQVLTAIPAAVLLGNDSDIDGDTLSINAVSSPSAAGAAVSLSDQIIRYQPLPNHVGPDSFQYTVQDGRGGQANAQVAVTVVQPRITEWSVTSNMLRLRFQAIPNRAYMLQSSEDLKTWNEIMLPPTSATGSLLWERTIPPEENRQFYRFAW